MTPVEDRVILSSVDIQPQSPGARQSKNSKIERFNRLGRLDASDSDAVASDHYDGAREQAGEEALSGTGETTTAGRMRVAGRDLP